ncbi:MAG: methylenetetrahydrofolate--tRNA-(uracil(54)-C(5))-methyltransferase (FADH(2)-oxidizing) TrmFO [Proteobacteria bacterium]|nr:MAG: methylenetetrahydrofolate--tRNA-(uracil(54)-C(5))-methyltransferase (FADH(2)-oxidizing) TrmFO [Pseudomonadota bacterium]
MLPQKIRVIGAGLAGCEAAHFLANKGVAVELYEMRPRTQTEAHQTADFAELVCSNSFKSLSPATAPGIMKREMEMLGSLSLACAREAAIGAGEALGVDRDRFSAAMTKAIRNHPLITVKEEEVHSLPDEDGMITILATGPLTSPALSESLRKRTGSDHFYFYDAISPIVDASSLDRSIIFAANRYGKQTRSLDQMFPSAQTGEAAAAEPALATEAAPAADAPAGEVAPGADYLNCPMNKEEYDLFMKELLRGERVEAKSFERVKHFEGCMPIEEMADRGHETLRFGPMKPVGLDDPRTGRYPYAAVQLRPENESKTAYNLVGFQTKLKYGEQARIFKLIPGLAEVEFLRMGSMHRNTFVDSPRVLNLDLSLKSARHILLAGQITGVEGYMESASIGILAGIFALARLQQRPIPDPPASSALGALLGHVRNTRNPDFQPSGINFGLFEDSNFTEALEALRARFKKKIPKDERRKAMGEVCLKAAEEYAARVRAF